MKVLNSGHSQQVSRFHKNLKSSQGDHLARLQTADLSSTSSPDLLPESHVSFLAKVLLCFFRLLFC